MYRVCVSSTHAEEGLASRPRSALAFNVYYVVRYSVYCTGALRTESALLLTHTKMSLEETETLCAYLFRVRTPLGVQILDAVRVRGGVILRRAAAVAKEDGQDEA